MTQAPMDAPMMAAVLGKGGPVMHGLAEAADTLDEMREILDAGEDVPRRVFYLAMEAAGRRVNAAVNWFDREHAIPDERERAMIELCDAYLPALAEAEAKGSDGPDDPLWKRVTGIEAALNAWEPATVQGLLAVARAISGFCKIEDPRDGGLGNWPEKMARAVLRMAGAA